MADKRLIRSRRFAILVGTASTVERRAQPDSARRNFTRIYRMSRSSHLLGRSSLFEVIIAKARGPSSMLRRGGGVLGRNLKNGEKRDIQPSSAEIRRNNSKVDKMC